MTDKCRVLSKGRFFGCLVTALLLLGSVPVLAKVDVEKTDNTTIFNVVLDDVSFEPVALDNKQFERAVLRGVDGFEGIVYRVGEPELPVVRLFVDDVDSLQVETFGTIEPKMLSFPALPLVPVQESPEKIYGAFREFTMNLETYNQDRFLGDEPYSSKIVGSVRGAERSLITLFPVAYNPVTGEKNIRKAFRVTVKHKNIVPAKTGKDAVLFIVGEKFATSQSLKKYESYKTSQGYKVLEYVVVRESDAFEAVTPAAIRKKVQEFYHNTEYSLKYAIIIGDHEDVPGAKPTAISGVVDHYYAAIDTNDYASDIGTPDIAVGRVSVSNESELSGVVEKFIKYQSSTSTSIAWLKDLSFLATDDQYELAEGTHNYVIDTYTKPKGYMGYFPNAQEPGGDKLYAVTHNATGEKSVASIKAGRAIVNYSGHGANTYWDAPRVSQADVRSLNHNDALPFVISNACITGDYRVKESFAETWIRQPKGAIMFWGSMDSSYWDEDDVLERRMFDGIFKEHNLKFGAITQYALAQLWKQYGGEGRSKYYFETYITFGDPSIELRLAVP